MYLLTNEGIRILVLALECACVCEYVRMFVLVWFLFGARRGFKIPADRRPQFVPYGWVATASRGPGVRVPGLGTARDRFLGERRRRKAVSFAPNKRPPAHATNRLRAGRIAHNRGHNMWPKHPRGVPNGFYSKVPAVLHKDTRKATEEPLAL